MCHVQLDVSLTTRFPTLMAVGLDDVATYNVTKAPEVLKGFYKYLSKRQYPLGTVVSLHLYYKDSDFHSCGPSVIVVTREC
jgi:hypothetical protein